MPNLSNFYWKCGWQSNHALEASAIYDIAKRRTRIRLTMTQIYPSLSGEKPCLQVQPHKYGDGVRTNIKKLTPFEFTNPIC